jgi:stage V sporulation protein AE
MSDMIIKLISAFVFGGFLCAIAQILIDKTRITPARILVSYVVSGVALTAIGVYEPLISIAGCGATTPLTGFGYCLASGVKKAIDKEGAIGILTGGLSGAAGGICAAILLGLIASVIFKGKPK